MSRKKGFKHTEKWKKEMSIAHKGLNTWTKNLKHSEETKKKMREIALRDGRKPSFAGRKHTKEAIEKIRQKKIGQNSGVKHPNWQGGKTKESKRIRNSIELRLWREAILARDSWTCCNCKKTKVNLVAHHIQNFAKYVALRTSIENGITFCQRCHKGFHKEYGMKNNTSKQLNNFLESK